MRIDAHLIRALDNDGLIIIVLFLVSKLAEPDLALHSISIGRTVKEYVRTSSTGQFKRL